MPHVRQLTICRALTAIVFLVAASVGSLPASASGTGETEGRAPGAAVGLRRAGPALQFDDDGLATSGTSTFVVDPAGRRTSVTVDLSATNQLPDESTSAGIRFFYFDVIAVPVLREATNLAASAGGSPLSVRLETAEGSYYAAAIIDLPQRLRFGQTQSLQLTYDLPDQPPRTDTFTRVNPGYALVSPIAFGDSGAASVRIVIPAGFTVQLLGDSQLYQEVVDGTVVLYADDIAEPLTFDAAVTLRDLDALDRHEVDGPYDVVVRSWPGDTEWSAFVAEHVRDGIPVLEDLIGLPWPISLTLHIDEAASPYLYGYAGWFDPYADRIEMGDELDPRVVLHELSHAWFDQDRFGERWINEGFAEEFAAQTLEALGQPRPEPEPVDPADLGRVALNEWVTPTLSSDIAFEQERYGYNASFAVMRRLSEEIGVDGLARVIAADAAEEIAYRGDPAPEQWASHGDWRALLDLFEEVGGSESASTVFFDLVVPESERATLAARTDARAALAELTAAGDGWTAPLEIRQSMSLWEFDEAADEMAEAHEVLERRGEMRSDLEPLDLEVPDALETAYESGEDIAEVADAVAALHETVDDLTDATEAVEGGHGIFTTVGLLGANPQRHLDAARDAFAEGDSFGVLTATELALDEVDQAEGDGQIRIAGVLIFLTVVGLAIHAWRSRRNGRAAALAAFTADAGVAPLTGAAPLTGVSPASPVSFGTYASPPIPASSPSPPVPESPESPASPPSPPSPWSYGTEAAPPEDAADR